MKKNNLINYFLIILLIVLIVFYFTYNNPSKKNSSLKYDNFDISFLSTSNYSFKINLIDLNFFKRYGAIDFIDNDLVYIDPNGIIYTVLNNRLKVISSDKLNTNFDSFELSVDTDDVFLDGFAVKDSLYLKNIQTILVSTILYKPDKNCYVLSIFSKKIKKQGYNYVSENWKKTFETNPCLDIFSTDPPFAVGSSGGRLVSFSSDEILLSVGDFYHYEGGRFTDLSSKLSNDYGKILKIKIDGKSKEIFSYGHRNPQGLALNNDVIFSTEHGPEGGDELNKIVNQGFYGYPLYSEGTYYGENNWINNSSEAPNQIKPFMSWTPAIGISNLIFLNNIQLPLWKNNLLIASLRAKSLFRLKYDENKVFFIEKIFVGHRIRDIVQNEFNGNIYMLTDPQGSEEKTYIIEMKTE